MEQLIAPISQSFPLPFSMLFLIQDNYKDRYEYKYDSTFGYDKSYKPYVDGSYEYRSDPYYPGRHQVIHVLLFNEWLSAYLE
jgi:hypothetical protein